MNQTVLDYLVRGLATLLGTAAFSVIFRIRLKLIPFAALGGMIAWFVWQIAGDLLGIGQFAANLLAALAATGYAEIMARLLKTPSTVFLTPAILPLVPGGAVYSTMVALVDGDRAGFAESGSLTLQVGVGIAAGIIVASIIGTFFRPLRPSFRKQPPESK